MKSTNKRRLFHLSGIIIVAFWLVMMGLLIKREEFNSTASEETDNNKTGNIDSSQKEWKEIFLKDRKVGYSISFITPFKGGYFIQDEVFLRLNLMGLDKGIYTITQTNTDDKFIIKDFVFRMNSGIITYNISGEVEGDRMLVKTGTGRDQNAREIRLSGPPVISAGMEHYFKNRKIQVGDTFNSPFFDPSTMIQKEAVFRVAARESLNINRIEYKAFRVEAELLGSEITLWVDESGVILKEEGLMGLVMIRSSAANASLGIEGSDDYYEMAAVPADRALPPDLESLTYLKLKLILDDGTIHNALPDKTERQSIDNGVMVIRLEKLPSLRSSEPDVMKDEDLESYLKPEFNIESDAHEIIAKAGSITGDEKAPVLKARKLLKWVYDNVDKRPVVSVPSAIEVLKIKVGDCNEHATLLTALLRASGIPARLAAGLVYNRGRFYYHAWTEAYLGRWISMDATLNQMPVDVSHICLVYGNLDKQVEIMGLIGRLKIEVIEFGHH
jgi:hypothetical protein